MRSWVTRMTLTFQTTTRILREERGSAAVEFAILLPVIVLTLVLSTDYAMAVLAKIQVEAAARAGAQYLVTNGYNVAQITTAVTGAISRPVAPITVQSITVECASTSSGTYNPTGAFTPGSACGAAGSFPYGAVTAQIAYRPLLPVYWTGLSSGSVPMTGAAVTRFQ